MEGEEGEIQNNSLNAVYTIIILFMGVYLSSSIYSILFPQNQLADYTYTTTTNTSILSLDASNQSSLLYVGSIPSISGSVPIETLSANYDSYDQDNRKVYVYLNGVLVGEVVATKSPDGLVPVATNATISISGLQSNLNNVSYVLGEVV